MSAITLSVVNKHYGTKHTIIDVDYEFTDLIYLAKY